MCAGKLHYKDILYKWVDELADMKTNQDAVPALRKFVSGASFEVDDDGSNVICVSHKLKMLIACSRHRFL